jgi:CRP-like cAMP-binding protein
VDIRGALMITGALLPILATLLRRRLAQLDAVPVPERQLALLRGIELFAPLPQPTQESLAQVLIPVRLSLGEELFRQGDVGDRFYIVADGDVEIVIDGQVVRETGPGGYFGEISLLRDVPRTATVRANGDVELYALDRDDFIAAVTGHAASAEVADSVIATRLGSLRPGMASV